ncbi:hypothetical protein BKA70DRAFT_783726 [Coprinopsis sp. MPI-PUGE-AT-0042]|nr:hypothetical protein BKA70DRAFT_783726 [Coprinopsis sp. MPI-PUGE-AT-0042]
MATDKHTWKPRRPIWLADVRTESTFEQIPVIDIAAAFTHDKEKRRELSDKILDAAINVGFFYIKNHSIPEETIQNAVEAGKGFFSLPESKKLETDIHKSSNYKGYTALLAENTDVTGNGDLHEGFDLGWEAKGEATDDAGKPTVEPATAMDGENVWPDDLPGFKDPVLKYYHAVYVRIGAGLRMKKREEGAGEAPGLITC